MKDLDLIRQENNRKIPMNFIFCTDNQSLMINECDMIVLIHYHKCDINGQCFVFGYVCLSVMCVCFYICNNSKSNAWIFVKKHCGHWVGLHKREEVIESRERSGSYFGYKQAISACERALCLLTLCFELQSESRKGHKNCALQMVVRGTEHR